MRAIQRAARNARKLSLQTGTPFYVMKDGKIVDLNRGRKKHAARTADARARRGMTGCGGV
jgi:hypothetical protein